MNPTLNTSSRRIIRLLVNDLRDPGRLVWLFAAAVIFGGLELLIMYKAQDQESINKPINILLLLILPFSLSFYSHWGLSLLHRRGRAEEYLMLPATLREKLVSRLLLTVVGLPLFWTLWTTLIGALGVVSGFSSTFFNPFEFWSAWGLGLYIALSTSCLLGSVWYSSPWGFKALLHSASVAILLSTAPIISTLGLVYLEFIQFPLTFSVNFAFFSIVLHSASLLIQSFIFSAILALAAFFVYLTHLRMREIEA